MTKIAIDARFYGTEHTGLGRYTMNVLAHLPKFLKKHELHVLLGSKYYNSLDLPSNCVRLRCDIPHYTFKEQTILPWILSRSGCDLLYTFHFNTPVLTQIPMIVTVHDLIKTYFAGSDTTTHTPALFALKRLGYKAVVKRTLERAVDVIVPTNTVKNQILANYPKVKPEHIHPIAEAPDSVFRQTNPKSESLNPKLPDKYILFVGNAYPHKNLKILLDAFRDLKDPDLNLVIVSKHNPFLARTLAPYEPRHIHVLESLTDNELVEVYRQARVLVSPSLMEGYGLPGIEAQMLATHVIASNIPVYHEVYGDTVTYFDPHSVDSLKNAIITVLKMPSPSPIIPTRTWADVARSIAEVIDESCARLRST